MCLTSQQRHLDLRESFFLEQSRPWFGLEDQVHLVHLLQQVNCESQVFFLDTFCSGLSRQTHTGTFSQSSGSADANRATSQPGTLTLTREHLEREEHLLLTVCMDDICFHTQVEKQPMQMHSCDLHNGWNGAVICCAIKTRK